MKVFITALTVLALLITVITINAIHVCNAVELMISAAQDMPPEPEDGAAAELSRLWDDHKDMICITVSHIETDAFTLAFGDLLAAIQAQETSDYLRARNSILLILHDIKHSETLAPDRIL